MRTLLLSLLLTCGLAAGSIAQETQVGFGTVNANPDDPVEVTAQRLNVSEADGAAIFSGDVIIVQGQMRLTAPRVKVKYDDATGDVSSMEATGGVTLVSGDEAAEASRADYDVADGMIVMTGNVLLTQGRSALTSDRMDVDLNDNTAVMRGSVKTVLHRNQSGGEGSSN
ncbi:MAG: LptA/OstA family protein [Marinovum sp.]|nr:LptA/OstA family protein [Marinovum sp.]